MLKYEVNIFKEGNCAIKTIEITFFSFVIFSAKFTMTEEDKSEETTNKTIGYK